MNGRPCPADGQNEATPHEPGPPVLVLAGPTASGKSALALTVAEAIGGTIINADSMQVYRELSIVTSRPTPADEGRVPHALYGVVPAAERCSVARWRALAGEAIAVARAAGRVPVVVGGSGLYLQALRDGLAPIPPIPEAVRAEARELLDRLGHEAFHARLATIDPPMASRLRVSDTTRLLRAWEVMTATGRSLAAWHEDADDGEPEPTPTPTPTSTSTGRLAARFCVLLLMPPRPALYAACDARFQAMLAAGALEEVRALRALGLDPALPAMKALGVPHLSAVLDGRMDLATATDRAQAATRHYAKRQVTWFRHRLPGARVISGQYSESRVVETIAIVRHFLSSAADGC